MESQGRGGGAMNLDAYTKMVSPNAMALLFASGQDNVPPDTLQRMLDALTPEERAELSPRQPAVRAYNPDQPRDQDGKWSAGGAGGAGGAGPASHLTQPGEHQPDFSSVMGEQAKAAQAQYATAALKASGITKHDLNVRGPLTLDHLKYTDGTTSVSEFLGVQTARSWEDAKIGRMEEAQNSLDAWNWVGSPHGEMRTALVQAAGTKFGIELTASEKRSVASEKGHGYWKPELAFHAKAVDKQYADMQQWYKDHPEQSHVGPDGHRYVTLYRGAYYPDAAPKELHGVAKYNYGADGIMGTPLEVHQGPIRSWTNSPAYALKFASNALGVQGSARKGRGYIFSAEVPVSKILSNGILGWGVPYAGEHVVIGGNLKVSASELTGYKSEFRPNIFDLFGG